MEVINFDQKRKIRLTNLDYLVEDLFKLYSSENDNGFLRVNVVFVEVYFL